MKRYIMAALVCAMIIPSFTSCKDMLKEEIYGQPTVDDMMKEEQNVALLVGQAYADVKWLHDHWGYWGVNLLTTDEGVCPVRVPGGHWNDGGYWKNLNTHNWNVFGDAFKNIWNTTISGAVLCNKLIYTLELNKATMSPQIYEQYISELEALRSYYYYMLFDCFGRIPYREDFGETKAQPLMEPAAVWARLVVNLENSAKKLPAVTDDASRDVNYGRCTQGMANALLARLYLNAPSYKSFNQTGDFLTQLKGDAVSMHLLDSMGIQIESEEDFYTNAARCCEAIIKSGSYTIDDNFFANFAIQNEKSKENIFVIVEEGSADFDYRDYAGSMANKLRVTMLTLHYCHKTTWSLIEQPWNGFCARPTFIQRYNEADVRGAGNEGKGTMNEKRWGWFVGPVCNAKGDTLKDENKLQAIIRPEIKSLDSATWNDGARMLKYEVDKSATYKYCENDFVLLRYADVLWMNEEAILRGGQGISHMDSPDFQRMLARTFANSPELTTDAARVAAFVEAYGDPHGWTVEEICDERGREFAWEMMRRRDLIRFGQFEKVEYVKNAAPERRWFPIPYAILEKAERGEDGKSIWTQNKGYE
ncbi:MAG: RagB/SusD family nutrient uptake outer membrane protein [Paludibacteraceae bacterium]|nr:RagB/SusD family nutrient uptake outer membrane protein [Paludibacteraceae bacterium]